MALAQAAGLVDAISCKSGAFPGNRVQSARRWSSNLVPDRVSFLAPRALNAACRVTHGGQQRASGVARVAVNGDGGRAGQSVKVPITFHFGETSLTLPFSVETAKGLSTSITNLLATFKEKEKSTRPQRWQSLEFRDTNEDGVYFELICNPNAYANAFQAKVLVTINDDKLRITSEGPLSAVKADVDQYIEVHA